MLVEYNVIEMKYIFNWSFLCILYLFNIVVVFIKYKGVKDGGFFYESKLFVNILY